MKAIIEYFFADFWHIVLFIFIAMFIMAAIVASIEVAAEEYEQYKKLNHVSTKDHQKTKSAQ